MAFIRSVSLLVTVILCACFQLNAQTTNPEADKALGRMLFKLDTLIDHEQYKIALAYTDTVLAAARSRGEGATSDTLYIHALHACGRTYYYRGKYEKAIATHEECLALRKKLEKEGSNGIASSLSNLGICYYSLTDYQKAIEYSRQAMAIYEKNGDPWLKGLADCWSNLANAVADSGNLAGSLEFYRKAFIIRTHNEGDEGVSVANLLQNAAGTYLALGLLDSAIWRYQASINIYRKKQAKPLSEANAWYNLGQAYLKKGNFKQAEYCLYTSLDLRAKKQDPSMLISQRGLGQLYNKMGDYDRAFYYLNGVMEARRQNPKVPKPLLINSLNDVATMAHHYEDWTTAEKLAREVVTMAKSIEKPDSLSLAKFLDNFANLMQDIGRVDTALVVHREALATYPHTESGEEGRMYCLLAMSICYTALPDLPKADSLAQMVFKRVSIPDAFDVPLLSETIRQMASVRSHQKRFAEADRLLTGSFAPLGVLVKDTLNLDTVPYAVELTKTLIDLANLHYEWALDSNDAAQYQQAILWGEKALATIARWESNLARSSSRWDTRALARKAREACAGSAFQLYSLDKNNRQRWLQTAFNHMEAAHNSQLHESMLESKTRRVENRPDEPTLHIIRVSQEVAELEKNIYLMENSGPAAPSDRLSESRIRLLQLKHELDNIKTGSEQIAGQQNFTQTPLNELQSQKIRPNQAFAEYLLTDSSLYIFWATNEAMGLIKTPVDTGLSRRVLQLRWGIKAYHELEIDDPRRQDALYDASLSEYANNASYLFEQLLQPVWHSIRDSKDLLIVPDGILNIVPFDALIEAKPTRVRDFSTYRFVVKDKNIGMAFSAAMQPSVKDTLSPATLDADYALIMAPFFNGKPEDLTKKSGGTPGTRGKPDSLPYSGKEAYLVWKSVGGGTVLYGKKATLQSFVQHAPVAVVVHLSTHAQADGRYGKYCYVTFAQGDTSEERLYVRDIYDLHLKAELLVMSACESALGEIQVGEGLIGLTRAFVYAGAKSVVSTLWSINDESSATVMDRFYDNLVRPHSTTKDDALSDAMRAYLADPAIGNFYKHPYFWAAFHLVGSQAAMK